MSFKEWLIENDYDDCGEYPSQDMYSSSEWDELYDLYESEIGGE